MLWGNPQSEFRNPQLSFPSFAAFIGHAAMENLLRYTFRTALVLGLLFSFPACNMQTSETAKEFYLEQMEKTNAFRAQEAAHAEKKEAKQAEKQSEPAPAKLVPDGK